MSYNLYSFLEIIESDPRVKFLRIGENREFPVRYYEGERGNLVMIDMSDEDPLDTTLKSILEELGMADRISSLFVSQAVVIKSESEA